MSIAKKLIPWFNIHKYIEPERNDMQLIIDPDQWTEEQCEVVQSYLERHINVFQRCRCDKGAFHDVIFDCYPTAAWKYMQRELALLEKSEQCPRRLLHFGAAMIGIKVALSRMR